MSLRYRITVLGCRVNHAETREMESLLAERGLAAAADGAPADLEVVHTCSVTNTAAAKSRQAIRRARRRAGGPTPEVLVTGCYAGTDPVDAARAAAPPSERPEDAPDDSPDDAPRSAPAPTSLRRDRVIPHDAAARSVEDRPTRTRGEHDGLGDGADGSHATMIERFAARVDAWLTTHPAGRPAPPPTPPHPGPAVAPDARAADPRAADPTDGPDAPPPPRVHRLPVVPLRHRSGRHVRAEIRIQDGCDAHCTFCVIPRIRRTLRSKSIADTVSEARQLVDAGHVEVVLAGVFIGAYGHETAIRRRQHDASAPHLADLLDAVAAVPGLRRLRISSMEPGDVDTPLLDAMVANRDVVVPHLHLPLQSGSDDVLRQMNRQYGVSAYLEMIDAANAALTEDGLPPAITTDVICGFPGETLEDFARTVAVAERVGYLHMHVFPYSPKRGTAAARRTRDAVPVAERKRRVRELIDLETAPGTGLADRYRTRLLGRRLRVILEQPDTDRTGWWTGRCDHYARVRVRADGPRGSIIDVLSERLAADAIVGVAPAAAPVPLPVLGG